MNDAVGNLYNQIEEKRKEMYEKIDRQSSQEEILRISKELDELIALYYK